MIDDIYRRFHESLPQDALCDWGAKRNHHHKSFTVRYWRNAKADDVSPDGSALNISLALQIESSVSNLIPGDIATMVSDVGKPDLANETRVGRRD